MKERPFVFHGVTDVTDCKSVAEVLEKSKLNFNVDIMPASLVIPSSDGKPTIIDIPNTYATYRTDTGYPLGVVKSRYTPVQNIAMFDFLDEVVRGKALQFDTAGCTDNGSRVFIAAKAPQLSVVGQDDPVENYIVFFNSHDGSSGFKIMYTPVRMVCFNKLNAAVKKAEEYFTFRHTKSIKYKIDYAKDIIAQAIDKINHASILFDKMFDTKITDVQVSDLIADVILNEDEKINVKNTGHTYMDLIYKNATAIDDTEISTRKVNTMHDVYDYYNMGIGQKKIMGTVWGAYNAVSGYYCNWSNLSGEKRMNSLMFGDTCNKIQKALEHSVELITV